MGGVIRQDELKITAKQLDIHEHDGHSKQPNISDEKVIDPDEKDIDLQKRVMNQKMLN